MRRIHILASSVLLGILAAGAVGCAGSESASSAAASPLLPGTKAVFCSVGSSVYGPNTVGLVISTLWSDSQHYRVTRGDVAAACSGLGPVQTVDLYFKPEIAIDADFLDGVTTQLQSVFLDATNAQELARVSQLHFGGHVDGPISLGVKIESYAPSDHVTAPDLAQFTSATELSLNYNAPLDVDALAPLSNLAKVVLLHPGVTMPPDAYLPSVIQLKSTSNPNVAVYFAGNYVDRDYVTRWQSVLASMYCSQFADDSLYAPRRHVCSGKSLP